MFCNPVKCRKKGVDFPSKVSLFCQPSVVQPIRKYKRKVRETVAVRTVHVLFHTSSPAFLSMGIGSELLDVGSKVSLALPVC